MAKKHSIKQRAAFIEVSKRRARVREMIVGGVTDKQQIRAALDITEITLNNDLTGIYRDWKEQDRERATTLKTLRVGQLEDILKKSMVSFQRSTEEQKEESVTRNPERCGHCNGSGIVGEEHDWCENCDGLGKVYVETITAKLKTKPGDVGYLSEARKCVEQLIRIEGHQVPARVEMDLTQRKIHTHEIAGQAIPADLLLDAMEAFAKLEIAQKKASIEVDSEAVEEDDVQ